MSTTNSLLIRFGSLSRRDLFRRGGLLGMGGLLPWRSSDAAPAGAAPSTGGLQLGPNVYESIGVRPLINCRGSLTVIGGSIELPEVRAIKDIANQKNVQMDELMDAVGKRLAELTGAEWGMVSSGCAAALAYATAACVAGGNPELHQRIPNLAGFARDEVIFPRTSRNNYDSAVRAVGIKIIEVESPQELELAIGPRTAMIYVLSSARTESGPMSVENIAKIAKTQNVPVVVDAAAEALSVKPNIHLHRGATLVAYSGGKIIRGPQSAGLLLGRKDLIKAAWVSSAPHHGFGRATKVGREEIIGMLMAVESWVKRDHEAEMREWVARAQHIADRVSKIPGVSASVGGGAGGADGAARGNRSSGVSISWDTSKIGITGQDLSNLLYTTEPRIASGGGGAAGGGGGRRGQAGGTQTSVSFNVSMIGPGEEKIVAERVYQVLSAKHQLKPVEPPQPPVTNLNGRWEVQIQYAASKSTHIFHARQEGNRVEGTHQGDFLARELSGTIDGDAVTLSSTMTGHGDSENFLTDLFFRFTGKVDGDQMSGSLDMGEYLGATWTARRHVFGRGAQQGD